MLLVLRVHVLLREIALVWIYVRRLRIRLLRLRLRLERLWLQRLWLHLNLLTTGTRGAKWHAMKTSFTVSM